MRKLSQENILQEQEMVAVLEMTDLSERLKNVLAFDGKAASNQFEKMRLEYEIGSEAFVSSGYYCHDVIVELARWQHDHLKPLMLTLADLAEVSRDMVAVNWIEYKKDDYDSALAAVVTELEKIEGGLK